MTSDEPNFAYAQKWRLAVVDKFGDDRRMFRLGIILLVVAVIAWCGGWEFQKRKMLKKVVVPLAQQKAQTESALAESLVQRITLERRMTRLCKLLDLNRYDISGAAEAELSIWVTGGGPGEIVYGTGATPSQEREFYLQRDHDNHRINIVDADDQGGGDRVRVSADR